MGGSMKKISFVFVLMVMVVGCNRGAARFHGFSNSFNPVYLKEIPSVTHPYAIEVELPKDVRTEYYGKSVGGTSWQGTRTDTFSGYTGTRIVQQEMERAIKESRLFVASSPTTESLVMSSELRVFGSQVRGFMWARAAGIVSLKIELRNQETVVFSKLYEKIITDGSAEYSGSQLTFIEQAMRILMSDSLRVLLQEMVRDLSDLDI